MTSFRSFRRAGIAGLAMALSAAAAAPVHGATPHAGARSGASIVLYSAQGYDSAMARAFQQVSAITVKLTDDSTGPLIARIEAERTNPHWDVVWFDGDSTMQALADQHLLYRWTPANVKNYTSLGASLIPTSHAFYPTGLTAAGIIIYNTHKLSPAQAPRDWSDLLSPRFKNAIAMNDPAYSGPTYPFIAGMLQRAGGIASGERFFTRLKDNGLKIFQTNDPTIHAVETGARTVAIVQDSAYYAARATGAPVGAVYPRSGVTALPGVVAINARSTHLMAAKAFVNYILSHAGQNVMLHDPNDADSYFVPIVKGVTALPGRRTHGVTFQRLNYLWAGAHENEIKAWFHTHIVQ